jgi:hypothetical protein
MSSTSSGGGARRFFDEQLMPAAKRMRAGRGDLFPTGREDGPGSYYTPRSRTRMDRADFELERLGSPDDLEPALRGFWDGRGFPELAGLAPGLTDVARALHETEEQTEEVSPFIYVMF